MLVWMHLAGLAAVGSAQLVRSKDRAWKPQHLMCPGALASVALALLRSALLRLLCRSARTLRLLWPSLLGPLWPRRWRFHVCDPERHICFDFNVGSTAALSRRSELADLGRPSLQGHRCCTSDLHVRLEVATACLELVGRVHAWSQRNAGSHFWRKPAVQHNRRRPASAQRVALENSCMVAVYADCDVAGIHVAALDACGPLNCYANASGADGAAANSGSPARPDFNTMPHFAIFNGASHASQNHMTADHYTSEETLVEESRVITVCKGTQGHVTKNCIPSWWPNDFQTCDSFISFELKRPCLLWLLEIRLQSHNELLRLAGSAFENGFENAGCLGWD
mmetsp:Transcript_122420/g.235951  ORF Transcript_122420/g.235951 Transcript_122420/m.235951 type:complete len:338 (-) Transcript_122420:138-1151(-)